jgi:hypothetical protein
MLGTKPDPMNDGAGKSTAASRKIRSPLFGPRLVLFVLGFAIPLSTGLIAVGLLDASSHPANLPQWAWPVYVTVSVVFGALASAGFTYDIASEIEVREDGMLARFGSREDYFAWRDIRPVAFVFPDKIRFRNSRGRPFFLRSRAFRELLGQQMAPSWDLPLELRKRFSSLTS